MNHAPDLPARIFGLFEANLIATILGELGTHDLPAFIQVTVADLAAQMLGIEAPILPARIFVQAPGNLGARIHSPLDLPGLLIPVQFTDLPASIFSFHFADLPARMLGITAPQFRAFIRGFAADIKDLPTRALPLAFDPGLPATITPVFSGDTGFSVGLAASIADDGIRSINFPAFLRSTIAATGNLGALIKTGGDLDLSAIISLLGAGNLPAIIGSIPEGERDRFLQAFLQPLMSSDLNAIMSISNNVAFLSASILSLRGDADLGAFIRTAETFVTAILTISTLASRDLRATIGNPNCAGGSASTLLSAIATAQHKGDLTAFIQSFAEHNLGARVNTAGTFFAYDTITVTFSPRNLPIDPRFNATDTISITFSPFRGQNLGAFISAIQNNVLLGATITAVFPLPKVVPAVSRLTAADLRLGEEQDIQEITLQLEGALREYIYVNGTETAFIKDPNKDWKINVRSFRPIAAGLFGDRAAGKICRLGNLSSFRTMDEAVRSCVQAVIGFNDESNMAAYILATGGFTNLQASVGVSDIFKDLAGSVGRVFPHDLTSTVSGSGGFGFMTAYIAAVVSGAISDMGAFIDLVREHALSGTVTTSGGQPFLPNVLNAVLLGAVIPSIYQTTALQAIIDVGSNTGALLLPGTSSSSTLPRLSVGIGSDIFSSAAAKRKFTVAFWVRWDNDNGQPTTGDTILGMSSDFAKVNGFGFDWVGTPTPPKIRFYVNNQTTTVVQGDTNGLTTTDQWIHVVGTYDADAASDNVKLYMNGELKASATHTLDLTGLANQLEIGRISSATPISNYSEQYFDDLGIWLGAALSASEIVDLFDSGITPLRDLRTNIGAYTHASNLAIYYKFDNTTTTFPKEFNVIASGTFDGTYSNLAVSDLTNSTPSVEVVSMDFNNSTRFVATGSDLPLVAGSTSSFSVMTWANKNITTAIKYVLGMHHSSDTTGAIPRMRLGTNSSNRWAFEMNTAGNSPTTVADSTQTVINNGTEWYHLISTYDSNDRSMKLYVDGVLVSSGTLSTTSKRIDEFSIGSARNSNNFNSHWDGFIDTVAVWDIVLDQDDVDEIYNGGSAETDLRTLDTINNLQAWYRLGEAGDTLITIVDRSEHDRDLPRTNTGNDIIDITPFT